MNFSALSAAQSGLTAASTSLAVGAHNVANTLTQGFVPQRADAAEQASGGVTVSISRDARQLEEASKSGDASQAPSRTDLVKETTGRINATAAYRANLKTVEAADEMSGVVVHLTDKRG